MSPQNYTQDPAVGAAELLRRFGMAMLGLALPCAAFYSRRAAILLLPLGGILVFMGTVIDPSEPIGARLRSFAQGGRTMIALGLGLWAAATIAWSPFPQLSAERLYNTAGVALVAAGAMAAIPRRMRAPVLYFLPIGAFAAVVAACVLALEARGAFRTGLGYDPVLAVRGAAAIALLTPVALGWLLSRDRAPEAIALGVSVLCATFVLEDAASIAVAIVTIVAFVFARIAQRPGVLLLGALGAALVLIAPLLPFAIQPFARSLGFDDVSALMTGLSESVVREGARLITGHGLETTPRAISAGILPMMQSPPLIVALWYDLGVLGALAIATLIATRSYGSDHSANVAAAEIALIWAALAQMFFGIAAVQAWWMSSFAAALIALRAIAFGQFRTKRPRVRLFGQRQAE
ncbi:hypothetical protein [Terrarubrum flagellatum]|uniref:hypothetical protein n=1 Tax=Terrirubrum flagellatum TaxID=2895980 RepID=UPI00314558B7